MGVLLKQFGMVPAPLMNYAPEGLARGFNTAKLPADPAAISALTRGVEVDPIAADVGYQAAEPV